MLASPKHIHKIHLNRRMRYAHIRIQISDDDELMGRLQNTEGEEIERDSESTTIERKAIGTVISPQIIANCSK
jgi:hypothetical protein